MYKWFKKKRRSGMLTLSLSETCVRENPDDFLAKVILEFFINCLVLHFLKACEIKIVTISAPRAQLPAGKSSIGKSTAETRQVKRQPRSVSMLTPRSRQGFPPAPFFWQRDQFKNGQRIGFTCSLARNFHTDWRERSPMREKFSNNLFWVGTWEAVCFGWNRS